MILMIPFLAASLLSDSVSASIVGIPDLLVSRQTNTTSEEEYLSKVCYPDITSPVVPPCQEIINIQSACTPNGTSGIYLLAHAQCMCGGSFFADWIGCLNCAYVHGARSPQNVDSFHTIITSASHALCTGTPTATFAAIFSSLSEGAAPTGSDTVKTDRFPSQTDIGLYYTVSGIQGVGAITGEAASATATVGRIKNTPGTGTGTASVSKMTGSSGSGTAGAAASSSSSKAGAAMPTGVWVGGIGAMVGAVGIAVL